MELFPEQVTENTVPSHRPREITQPIYTILFIVVTVVVMAMMIVRLYSSKAILTPSSMATDGPKHKVRKYMFYMAEEVRSLECFCTMSHRIALPGFLLA